MHLEALPHIIASEPSALNMRMEKSASADTGRPISTSPSLPMPLWRELHFMCGGNDGLDVLLVALIPEAGIAVWRKIFKYILRILRHFCT